MATFTAKPSRRNALTGDLVLTLREREERRLATAVVATGHERHGGAVMADLVYLAIAAGFFWLTWLLVKLCERL